MHAHHVFDFVMYVTFAVGALAIGFGQGLAFNVKGFTFRRGLSFSASELLFVALTVFLVSRNVTWMAIVIGFLAIGMLVGIALTRNERPPRTFSGGARPGQQVPGWKVPPPSDDYEESPFTDLYA